ncbi:LOW QUALITY PROTEIN: phosphatidylserine lipase ABHD16A-like [Ammospiza nelsoni]|uniref:LOW QUALITY PROTEIN: phosphatidylserine lipase ABHD16A-like n=1 Tax=Ammospiza nelsoni TaxID=2857394 RepID=UPI00286C4046|nr:LOW QUALITY PROTEIN: phosphatidylserine lipase ABHD16A-like [Ammospiza nelsoni]
MAKLLSCVLGPRLYRVHRPRPPGPAPGSGGGGGTERGEPAWDSYYQPRGLEKHTDSVLALASVLWSISYYASPLAVLYLYRKGLLTMSRVVPLSHCAATLGLLLAGVACLRGLGRWSNPQYLEFMAALEESHRSGSAESKRKLGLYTFDFRSWPVDFRWDSAGPAWGGSRAVPLLQTPPRRRGGSRGLLGALRKLPCALARWLLAHTLGRRMLFPGSVRLLQRALLPALLQGQARLIEQVGGQRVKLLACDGNEIDAMVIDRRGRGDPRGDTLVICCEGNAGFYEVGCVSTPLEAGYSVLGWNHPGFGGSTGVPLPQSEANAMDVVVRFALQQLRFAPPSIVVYAWSIGGFTATWAAMSYPELGGLVLDASFDDLVPLALKVLPRSWRELVTQTVREHLNLNNAEQLCRYQGPVLLVRRTKDEIITTTSPHFPPGPPDDIASNRGNDLLLKLLQHRYPKVVAEEGLRAVREWLEAATPEEQSSVLRRCAPDERWCRERLRGWAGDRSPPFPWGLGEDLSPAQRQQLALYLAQQHLQNFEASHCTPLPPQAFRLPWAL